MNEYYPYARGRLGLCKSKSHHEKLLICMSSTVIKYTQTIEHQLSWIGTNYQIYPPTSKVVRWGMFRKGYGKGYGSWSIISWIRPKISRAGTAVVKRVLRFTRSFEERKKSLKKSLWMQFWGGDNSRCVATTITLNDGGAHSVPWEPMFLVCVVRRGEDPCSSIPVFGLGLRPIPAQFCRCSAAGLTMSG